MDIWHWLLTICGSLVVLATLWIILSILWLRRHPEQLDIRRAQKLLALRHRDPQAVISLILIYERILAQAKSHKNPTLYASTLKDLGNIYSDLPMGDRGANVTQAIAYYEEALRFWTLETAPFKYAMILTNLGKTYSDLPTGDRAANLVQAITYSQEALRFWMPEYWPFEYALTQNNLGRAYVDLTTGDRAANVTRAIAYYEEALRFWTPEAVPFEYARTQNNLGAAYNQMPIGERGANLTQAITCYQEALRFWTPETAPYNYAMTQNNLGTTYSQMPTGDRTSNLTQAIACYQEALRFWTPEAAPSEYALAQNNLGNTYLELITGNRITHLKQAIAYYEEALCFWTPETAPLNYALAQNNLGNACWRAVEFSFGDQRESFLTQAIACYQEASRFWTPETASLNYAMAQTNLGMIYWTKIYYGLSRDDREANLIQAITYYQEALRVLKPEGAPFDYARTQNNMGLAYSDLQTGDRKTNLAQAITCYQEASRFWTLEASPLGYRRVNSNLADLHFTQEEWEAALVAYHAAINAREHLYRTGQFVESKEAEMTEGVGLYRNAAFAAVRCRRATEGLLILEQGKARLLAEVLRLRIRRPANVPNEVWTSYEHAKAAVRAAQYEESSVLGKVHELVQSYEMREQAARAAHADLDATIEQVRVHSPDFLKEIDFPATLALLSDEHTVLVAFCITNQGSLAFVLSQNQLQALQVVEISDFTRSELRHLLAKLNADGVSIGGWIGTYEHYKAEPNPTTFQMWQEVMTSTLAELGERLFAPILSALSPGVERIILQPSVELFLLPLHAVSFAGNDSDRMCDRYLVSYAPSIEVIADARAKAIQEATPELYAVINPQNDPQLIFTQTEGVAIAKLFAHHIIDEGQDGTKQHTIAGVQGRTYVHFSCHGIYDWYDPVTSGLDLADNRLTLADLQYGAVDLSAARLVTLSACETGISDILKDNAEEYVGIPAGFMMAGVPCVVSSLWTVPDLSTALLMERFYSNHLNSGMDFAAALREAQIWVRELEVGEVAQYAEQCYRQSIQSDKGELFKYMRHYRYLTHQNPTLRPFAHPYYWAAFTVYGM